APREGGALQGGVGGGLAVQRGLDARRVGGDGARHEHARTGGIARRAERVPLLGRDHREGGAAHGDRSAGGEALLGRDGARDDGGDAGGQGDLRAPHGALDGGVRG